MVFLRAETICTLRVHLVVDQGCKCKSFGASFACFWAAALKLGESLVKDKRKKNQKNNCLSPTWHVGSLLTVACSILTYLTRFDYSLIAFWLSQEGQLSVAGQTAVGCQLVLEQTCVM